MARPSLLAAAAGGLLLAVAVGAAAAWFLTLPGAAPDRSPQVITNDEVDATIAALRPPKRSRPVIAVLGLNDGTETTDYLMPYGVLRRADVAEVLAIGITRAPIVLFPSLKVEPQASISEFDARHIDGADYVIVPAMRRDNDPTVLAWIKDQAARGAIIVGVCAGAKVVAAAGLLDGRRATTHWYYLNELRKKHPDIRYVADRRIVVDGPVVTTTGISASMPMSLALIEAIAGADKARAVADDLGVAAWDALHDSGMFRFTRAFATTAIANTVAFWKREQLSLELAPNVDEVSLALVADVWGRTYRSSVTSYAAGASSIETRNGIRIVPDRGVPPSPDMRQHSIAGTLRPIEALNSSLDQIAARYGPQTAEFVAMQLEYVRPAVSE